MAYCLQFPFQLQGSIAGIELPIHFQIRELQARLFSRSSYVVLELSGFNTQEEASVNVSIVWAALRWVLIDHGINATFDLGPNDIVWAKDPMQAAINLSKNMDIPNIGPVHGIAASDGCPIVFREDQNILFGSLSMTGEIFIPPTALSNFQSALEDAFSRHNTKRLYENPRFRLAADLYSAYYFEHSPSSRLVTLAMALEVIADPASKHSAALELIDRWKADINGNLAVAIDQNAIASLKDLKSDLHHIKQNSIGDRIRNTANRLASYLEVDEQENLIENVVATYKGRNELMHNGRLKEGNIHELVERGKRTVGLLLKAYYRDIIQNEAM